MGRPIVHQLFHWLHLDFSRGFRAHSVQYILSVLLALLPTVQSKICGMFFWILLLLVSLYSAVRSLLYMQSGLGSRWNKENCSGSPSKQLQRLRVELSDKTFQLHKLQQDYAQERAHSSAEVQRERAHLLKQLKQLREKNVFDNEEWSNKIAQQRKQHSREIQKLEEKYANNLGRDVEQVRRKVEKEFQKRVAQLQLALQQLKECSQVAITQQRKNRIKEIQESQSKWEHLLQSQKKQDNLVFETMKKQLQQKINVLQRLYLSEEKSKQAIAQNMQRHLQESVKEKLTLEASLSHEKSIVSQLNNKLALAEHEIKQLNQQIEKNKKEMQAIIVQIQKDHSRRVAEVQQQHRQNLKTQQSAFVRESQLLHIEFKRFRELQGQKQKKWQERGEKVFNNMSKEGGQKGDDTAKILQTQLKRKQGQLQHQKQALRLCRLQLENMAQVYDKVFLANNYLNRQRGKSFKIQQKAQLCHSGVLQPLRARLRTHGDQ